MEKRKQDKTDYKTKTCEKASDEWKRKIDRVIHISLIRNIFIRK